MMTQITRQQTKQITVTDTLYYCGEQEKRKLVFLRDCAIFWLEKGGFQKIEMFKREAPA